MTFNLLTEFSVIGMALSAWAAVDEDGLRENRGAFDFARSLLITFLGEFIVSVSQVIDPVLMGMSTNAASTMSTSTLMLFVVHQVGACAFLFFRLQYRLGFHPWQRTHHLAAFGSGGGLTREVP